MRRSLFLGVSFVTAGMVAASCGGGEKATPTPTVASAPRPTATRAAAPTATAVVAQPTATAAPAPTSTPRPAATATPASAQPTGRLRVAIGTFSFEQFEPSQIDSVGFGAIGAPLFDWLLWVDREGKLTPGLALSWQMAADAKSWTYTLRPMSFHNGDQLTADDVKFSIERVVRPESHSSNANPWRANLASIDVLSPQSVRVNAKTPWLLMNYDASSRGGGEGVVIPKAYFERVGEAGFQGKPVGTGPWTFVSHTAGQRIVYQAATTKHPYRAQPRYQTLELLQVPEASTRLAMVKTGEGDIAEITAENLASAKQSNLKILEIPATLDSATVFVQGEGAARGTFPTDRVEVRKALTLAINRQEIIDTILGGFARAYPRFLVIPGQLGFDPSWQSDPYDPAAAKQLLARAGFEKGFSLRFNAPSPAGGAWFPRAAEAVAGYWSAIGVQSNLVPLDAGTYNQLIRRKPKPPELQGAASMQQATVLLSPLLFQFALLHSGGILSLLPEGDALITEAQRTTDAQKQIELIRQISNTAHDAYVAPDVLTASGLYVAARNIKGWSHGLSYLVGQALETVEPQ